VNFDLDYAKVDELAKAQRDGVFPTTELRAVAFAAKVSELIGQGSNSGSSANEGLPAMLHGLGRYPDCGVEIGTFRGMSSVVMAHFCRTLISMDVAIHSDLPRVLEVVRLMDPDVHARMCCLKVPDNDAKVALLSRLDFDFAFIDGQHSEGQTALDFAMVRKCGEVLVHDVRGDNNGIMGVETFLDRLKEGTIEKHPPFALWRR
jgi:hypothetical protein